MVSLYKHGGKIIVFNGLMVGDILEFKVILIMRGSFSMIQDGVAGLADMEATFPHLQAQRTAIEDFLARSVKDLGDPDDVKPFGSQDEGSQNNILLPSMNKVWPQLVPCLRHTKPAVHSTISPLKSFLFALVMCDGWKVCPQGEFEICSQGCRIFLLIYLRAPFT